jgi:hypothetical protein
VTSAPDAPVTAERVPSPHVTEIASRYLAEAAPGEPGKHLHAFSTSELAKFLIKDCEHTRYGGDSHPGLRLYRFEGAGQLTEMKLLRANPDTGADDSDYFHYDYEVCVPGQADLGDGEWLCDVGVTVRIDRRA